MPIGKTSAASALDNVLVVTIRKRFWASPESLVFPHRLYEQRIGKVSENRPSRHLLAARALVYTLRHKPRVVFFGTAHKAAARFAKLKQRGYLQDVKLIATNQMSFDDSLAEYLDKILVYSRSEIATHKYQIQSKYEFVPIPVDAKYEPFESATRQPPKRGDYIFCGGVTRRDFTSLIDAVRGLDVRLIVNALNFEAMGYHGTLPENCEFLGLIPQEKFMELMANSLFVAVPLMEGADPHGHTTVAQAFALGKAVLSTKHTSVDDYITDNCEGLLVAPGDANGYREAILRLQKEPGLLDACEQRARLKAKEYTYSRSAERFVKICNDVLAL